MLQLATLVEKPLQEAFHETTAAIIAEPDNETREAMCRQAFGRSLSGRLVSHDSPAGSKLPSDIP